MSRKLLAKPNIKIDGKIKNRSVEGHTWDVVNAFVALFGTRKNPTDFAKNFMRFFKIRNWNKFYINAMIACILHDLGKATNSFQRMMYDLKNGKQSVRHEVISALIAYRLINKLADKYEDLDPSIYISAIMGHHTKCNINRPEEERPFGFQYEGSSFFVKFCKNDIQIRNMAKDFFKDENFFEGIPEDWYFDGPFSSKKKIGVCINEEINEKDFKVFIKESNKRFKDDEELNQYMMAVRAALINSDAIGSAIFEMGGDKSNKEKIEEFARRSIHSIPQITPSKIKEGILKKKEEEFEKRTGKKFKYYDFQKKCATLPDRTSLIHSCGGGKTIAGYMWACGRQNVKRILWLSSTRGVCNESFKNYMSHIGEESTNVHSSAHFDLKGMFDSGDPREDMDFSVEDKMFALGMWDKTHITATLDQFLNFMESAYGQICLLPLMAESAIIIDEIHSIGPKTLIFLKKFLKKFDVPVLTMTASMPKGMKKDLKECGMKHYQPRSNEVRKSLDYKRYRIHRLKGMNKESVFNRLFKIVKKGYWDGKKVLVIFNTIRKCRDFSKYIKNKIPELEYHQDLFCYHSKFIVYDRKKIHDGCIKSMEMNSSKNDPTIISATQVCEMSFDISCDILISEECPIFAAIQRLGRCNRIPIPLNNKKGDVYFFSIKDPITKITDTKPYSKKDMEGYKVFYEKIHALKTVSQKELIDLLDKYGYQVQLNEEDKYCTFVDGGCYLYSTERRQIIDDDGNVIDVKKFRRRIRDIKGWQITVMLDRFVEDVEKSDNPKLESQGYTLSLPPKESNAYYDEKFNKDNKIPSFIHVLNEIESKGIEYDDKTGFGYL